MDDLWQSCQESESGLISAAGRRPGSTCMFMALCDADTSLKQQLNGLKPGENGSKKRAKDLKARSENARRFLIRRKGASEL